MTREQVEQVELRPFHETIVEAIKRAFGEELYNLAELIKTTKIPQGHDEIIKAWKARIKKEEQKYPHSRFLWVSEDFDIPASLLAQKRTAKAKASEKSAQDSKWHPRRTRAGDK